MAKDVRARIAVTPNTLETLNRMKRGLESSDSLIRRLVLHAQNTGIRSHWELSVSEQQFINDGEKIQNQEANR
jgi:predicted CopG family antitoxin